METVGRIHILIVTLGSSISGSLWTSLTSCFVKASSKAWSISSASSVIIRFSLDDFTTVLFSRSSLSLTTTKWMSFPAFFKTCTASWWVAREISTPFTYKQKLHSAQFQDEKQLHICQATRRSFMVKSIALWMKYWRRSCLSNPAKSVGGKSANEPIHSL